MEAVFERSKRVTWQRQLRSCFFLFALWCLAPGYLPAEEAGKSFEDVWSELKLNYQQLAEASRILNLDLQKTQSEFKVLQTLNLQQSGELKRLNGQLRELQLELMAESQELEKLNNYLTSVQASLRQATESAKRDARRNRWVMIGVGAGTLVLGAGVGLIVGLAVPR